ncbi:MAG: hypothetical protein ACI4N3_02160 [Alphaproteobacteria bacterium]
MKVKNLKNIGLLLIATIFAGNVAHSQTTNMALPSQVGVYNPNIRTQQMQLPPQVGVYNPNIPTQQMKLPPQTGIYQQQARYPVNPNTYRNMPTVNYNKNPVINENLYDEINGYKTPNRYTLNQPKIVKTAYNNYGNKTTQQLASNSDDFGVEYYLALNYGITYFDDDSSMSSGGVVVTDLQFEEPYDFPLNNVKHALDDGKNFSIGFGVMSNRKQKVELFYSNISGLKYGDYATAENQWCPSESDENGNFYYDCTKDLPVDGGKISSNTFGINMYFPLEELFGGKLFDGLITPYIGGGIGITFNTVDDYTVSDSIGNGLQPITTDGLPYLKEENGSYTTCDPNTEECDAAWGYYDYDGIISHYGATTNNVSWNLEAGLSFDLDSKTIIDVYFKHNSLGKVKSSNEAFSSYYTVNILDATETENTVGNITTRCTIEAINDGFIYNEDTGWCESEEFITEQIVYNAGEKGTLENNEIGVKLRLIF